MSGLYGLLAMGVFVVAILGVVMVRDQGLRGASSRSWAPARASARASSTSWSAAWARPASRWSSASSSTTRPGARTCASASTRRGAPAGSPSSATRGARARSSCSAIGLALFALVSGSWLSALALLFLGAFGFDAWLHGTARRRQEAIERGLPDFLDILAVCVSAGIAFRPALGRVAEASEGPLREEMQLVLRQIALGAPRREAFDALRQRNTSVGIGTFVTAVQQAEELGVPLTDALVDLARDMRQSAFQRARQRAQKATPRVSIVTTAIIAPGAVIIIVASLFANIDISPLK